MTSPQQSLPADDPQLTAEADSSASGNAILEFASEHCPDTPLAVGPSSVPGASAQPAGVEDFVVSAGYVHGQRAADRVHKLADFRPVAVDM